MDAKPFIIAVLGWSGSGKTLFMERAIAELARRGIACAAAKATRHGGDFEPPGKDTARIRAAGAAATAYIGTGPGGLTVRFTPSPPSPDRAFLESLFPGARLILAEGLEAEDAFVVLVDGPAESAKGAAGGTTGPGAAGAAGPAGLAGAASIAANAPGPGPAPGLRGSRPGPKRGLDEIDLLVTEDPAFAQRARDAGVPALAPGETAAFIDLLEETWKGT